MVKKHIYDKIVKNIGIHNSPLIPGWHLHNKKEIKGSVYKNFGKNWWGQELSYHRSFTM